MADAVEGTGSRGAQVAIDREGFLTMVVGALSDTLGTMVGQREAEGFVNLVGMTISEQVLALYLKASGASRLNLVETLDAILDWKRRLGGDFRILETTGSEVVLINSRCPFAGPAAPPGAMCKMTSHVIGHMVAESQGYGRVTLADTIARGSPGCRIVIDLDPGGRDRNPEGQSYFARGRH